MSQMTFTILDAGRAIHAQPHASFVSTLIPALSDDPETIEELRYAIRRFLAPEDDPDPLAAWSPGDCDEPFDAGICIVDLPARLILFQSTYSNLLRRGQVAFDQGDLKHARCIPYKISDEWLVMDRTDQWRATSPQRRQLRQANGPLDTRAVLYDKVLDFIVDECIAARGGSTDSDDAWTPPAGWQWRELRARVDAGRPLFVYDAVAEIHARWLMTPRDDLRGQTPRDVLHAKRSDIAVHVQDREFQWTTFGEQPPALWPESIAYRFGGYGTHEIVVYYYLVRHLIHECWELVVESGVEHGLLSSSLAGAKQGAAGTRPGGTPTDQITRTAAIERLGAVKQEWLHSSNHDDFGGKTPAQLIEWERMRLPMGVSGDEAMIDHDCPLCQMMADSGPFFWHLDGCNMDDDFPFALFETTREEWEEMHHEWSEMDAAWERERAEQVVTGEDDSPRRPDAPALGENSCSVWQRSFGRSDANESPALTLFGLGSHVAELVEDLRQRRSGGPPASADSSVGTRPGTSASSEMSDSRRWIDTLNRDFSNLREAVANPGGSLVGPIASKFSEHLLELSETHPELALKCGDLDRQLADFARRLSGEPEPNRGGALPSS